MAKKAKSKAMAAVSNANDAKGAAQVMSSVLATPPATPHPRPRRSSLGAALPQSTPCVPCPPSRPRPYRTVLHVCDRYMSPATDAAGRIPRSSELEDSTPD